MGAFGKTLHWLDLADDELYHRSLPIQVNTGERRHALAGTASHARRGHLQQAYREAQEDHFGALGSVLNAIVVRNTRSTGFGLNGLRNAGMPINPEDAERLSPLLHHHIHLDGRYIFALPEAVAQGELRPPHDPTDPTPSTSFAICSPPPPEDLTFVT